MEAVFEVLNGFHRTNFSRVYRRLTFVAAGPRLVNC